MSGSSVLVSTQLPPWRQISPVSPHGTGSLLLLLSYDDDCCCCCAWTTFLDGDAIERIRTRRELERLVTNIFVDVDDGVDEDVDEVGDSVDEFEDVDDVGVDVSVDVSVGVGSCVLMRWLLRCEKLFCLFSR